VDLRSGQNHIKGSSTRQLKRGEEGTRLGRHGKADEATKGLLCWGGVEVGLDGLI